MVWQHKAGEVLDTRTRPSYVRVVYIIGTGYFSSLSGGGLGVSGGQCGSRWLSVQMFLRQLLCLLLLGCREGERRAAVLTDRGWVGGRPFPTRSGRTALAFQGIPYAEPPLGLLRYSEPVATNAWIGVLDYVDEVPSCLQFNLIIPGQNTTTGQEDCLYLSVYTPATGGGNELPVMVYLHGGAYYFGGIQGLGASYLLDQDIVLVEVNYRLGSLGFLSLEDDTLPGNLGLKDQSFALRWVKRNVRAFGGDPESVTVFGASVGAIATHLHILSPLSKGLLQRGISISGTGLCSWGVLPPGLARSRTLRLAESLGCPLSTDIIDCLRTKDARQIVDAQRQFFVWGLDPLTVFGAVVERGSPGAFLTVAPRRAASPPLPWITGVSSGEGIIRSARFTITGEKDYDRLNKEFNKWIPITLFYGDTASDPDRISDQLKRFYFGNNSISEDTLQNLTDMFTDGYFLHPAIEALERHSGPSYFYYFDYLGVPSFADIVGTKRISSQATHTDETIYLFNLTNFPALKGQDEAISKELVKLWTNFAKYGNPTPANSFIDWEPWGKHRRYLNINKEGIGIRQNLLEERLEFWKHLQFRDKL